jgi:uncharacterized protein with von Willebrand factor type A (vWA) domain
MTTRSRPGLPDAGDEHADEGIAIAIGFARVLRGAGLEVPVGATILFARALAAIDVADPDQVGWAGRAVFVIRPEDRDRYDRCFRAWFLDQPASTAAARREPDEVVLAFDQPGGSAADADEPLIADAPVVAVRFSRAEVLRRRDFATYTAAEHDEARRLMADLRIAGAQRRSRRHRPTGRGRGRLDLRRTLRRSLATGGEPIDRAFRAPTTRPRRVVLLCDVSGSMEPYSRALVRFLHTAVVARSRVEAFALGTRLTRLTRALATRDPDAALANAAARVADWSGGTRLGEGLRTFNREWGGRGMAHGAVVVIVSDGWERGDVTLLATEMERLGRVAHRVVWVNPLKASPGYAPLAAGMAAALPFVDDFVEGHSLASLEALVDVVARP